MARAFDDASSHEITTITTPVTDVPLSLACWFNSDDVAAQQTLLSIGDTAGNLHHFSLLASGDEGGDPVRALVDGSAFVVAASSSGFSVNTWHHAAAVFASSTDRRAYIDGGSKGTDVNSATVSSLDAIGIGVRRRLTSSAFMSGLIAEVAIWSVALTDDEVAVLGAGYSPLLVHPQSLVFYAPLIRTIQDVVGAVALTNVNSTVADHCRILNPAPIPTIWTPGAAALLGDHRGSFRGVNRGVLRGVA